SCFSTFFRENLPICPCSGQDPNLCFPKTQFILGQQIIHHYLIKQQGPFHIYHMPTVLHHYQGGGTVLLRQLPYRWQEQVIFFPHNIKGRDIDIYRSKETEQGINFRSEPKPTYKFFLVQFLGLPYKK